MPTGLASSLRVVSVDNVPRIRESGAFAFISLTASSAFRKTVTSMSVIYGSFSNGSPPSIWNKRQTKHTQW